MAYHVGRTMSSFRRDILDDPGSAVDDDSIESLLVALGRPDLPLWGKISLLIVLLVGAITVSSVCYTLWQVVLTLTIVESPTATVSLANEKSYCDDEEGKDLEVFIIKEKPITSSIRGTLKHLRAQAGIFSVWRGLGPSIACAVTLAYIEPTMVNLLGIFAANRDWAKHIISFILTSAIVTYFGTIITHVIISAPSNKYWWQRGIPFNRWKKAWRPTIMVVVAFYVTLMIPLIALIALRPDQAADASDGACKYLLVGVLALVLLVGLSIPASAVLIRVQASLLPEEYDTIVPFDRNFGGKVIPEVVGGSGALSSRDAWKSVDAASRIRILKCLVKFFIIKLSLEAFFFLAAFITLVIAGSSQT